MKKSTLLLSLIIAFTILLGCSTSTDSNGNTTTTGEPVSPTSLTGTVASQTQINLSWTDNSTNETGFKIERKTGTGAYAVVGTVNANITVFNDSGLLPSTAYTYRVYSYNTGGNSPTYSNEVTLATITGVPLSPTNLTGTVASQTEINLSWTDNSTNETGFKIERKTGNGVYSVVGTVNTNITVFNDSGLLPSTFYSYRVYSYNSMGNSPIYSNEVTISTTAAILLPTLSTTAASSITSSSAVSGGTILSDGGANITARGVVWSTRSNPTLALTTTANDSTGAIIFSSNLTGLSNDTTYYIRSYASNSAGTAYGNEVSFTTLKDLTGINVPGPNMTDIDGNVYESITNCGQTWSKSNMKVSKYTDGTPIPQVTDQTTWYNLTTGAWCYYENDPANEAVYGKLYNMYAVLGIYDAASAANPALRKKFAPIGWHVPTDAEWSSLTTCLGGEAVAGGKMKSTSLWQSPNTAATNESGFTGLPGGYRWNTLFRFIGIHAIFWSSSEVNGCNNRQLYSDTGIVYAISYNKAFGFSVRCLKD